MYIYLYKLKKKTFLTRGIISQEKSSNLLTICLLLPFNGHLIFCLFTMTEFQKLQIREKKLLCYFMYFILRKCHTYCATLYV